MLLMSSRHDIAGDGGRRQRRRFEDAEQLDQMVAAALGD
jgi:hypothetical protein